MEALADNIQEWIPMVGYLAEVQVEGPRVKHILKGRFSGKVIARTCPYEDKCILLVPAPNVDELLENIQALVSNEHKVQVYEIPNKVKTFFDYWNDTFRHIQVAWKFDDMEEGVLHLATPPGKEGLLIGTKGWKLKAIIRHLPSVHYIKVHPAIRVIQKNLSEIQVEDQTVYVIEKIFWESEDGRRFLSIDSSELIMPYYPLNSKTPIAGYVAPWVLEQKEQLPPEWGGVKRLWHY